MGKIEADCTMEEVEVLRRQMIEAALQRQSFVHDDVLLLSKRLDQMIVKIQQEKCLCEL